MPYVNGKFIASINESKGSNKWENHFLHKKTYHIDSNFFESYEPKLKNASFDIGTLLFPYSFNTQNNIEFDLGFKHDSKSNYGIVGAQFSNDLGYVFIKDYINHHHNFIITTGVNRKNFGISCEYQAFDFQNELNHKINANVYFQLTRDLKININGLYRVKPNQELINSGFSHLVSEMNNPLLTEPDGPDGKQYVLNYDGIIPYHGVAIKHLLQENNDLKHELSDLKHELSDLKQMINLGVLI
jgi:hypothetical protein